MLDADVMRQVRELLKASKTAFVLVQCTRRIGGVTFKPIAILDQSPLKS